MSANKQSVLNIVICVLGIVLFANCQPAASQALPDIVIKRVDKSEGGTTLDGWSEAPGPRGTVSKVLTPQNDTFSAARLFYESHSERDPKSATEAVLKLNGFQRARFRSSHQAETSFVKTIDGHSDAAVTTFFYDGELGGKPAKAIMYTWGGQVLCKGEAFCSIVHVLMAPNAEFEALGGGAALAVAWLQQDVPASVSSMKNYGALPPKEAAEKLAQYANNWMASYIQTHVQMMQMMGQTAAINQQVLSSMQSYNTALSQCGGWECSFSQGGDGMWTATPD